MKVCTKNLLTTIMYSMLLNLGIAALNFPIAALVWLSLKWLLQIEDKFTSEVLGCIVVSGVYSFWIHHSIGEDIWKGRAKFRGLFLFLIFMLSCLGIYLFSFSPIYHKLYPLLKTVENIGGYLHPEIGIALADLVVFIFLVEIPHLITYGSWELLGKIRRRIHYHSACKYLAALHTENISGLKFDYEQFMGSGLSYRIAYILPNENKIDIAQKIVKMFEKHGWKLTKVSDKDTDNWGYSMEKKDLKLTLWVTTYKGKSSLYITFLGD